MQRTLVNIIGGQTQPNILMAKEIYHHIGQLDRLVLVHTLQTEPQAKRTQEACSEIEAEVIMVDVVEDDIINIGEKLMQQVPMEPEEDIFVNITGGTKIMSIAVFNHFEKYSAKILYVALGKNTFHQVFPRVKNKVTEFRYTLNLHEYFTGYGVSIANPESLHKLSKSEEATKKMFIAASAFTVHDWEKLDLIRQGFDGKSYRGKSVQRSNGKSTEEKEHIESIFSFLEGIDFSFENSEFLSKVETKYLTGDWFEEYVYAQLKSILNLDPSHWGMGLQINIIKNEEKVNNELDLAIMVRNELHLIECKTRLVTTDGSNIMTETLYKVDSLRSKFGLNVKALLFTLAEEEELKKGAPRGKLNDISIVSRDKIQDPKLLANILKV